MPTPKRKRARGPTRNRRAQWRLAVPTKSTCPQCHAPKLPHRVCGRCGYYAGREVVEIQ